MNNNNRTLNNPGYLSAVEVQIMMNQYFLMKKIIIVIIA